LATAEREVEGSRGCYLVGAGATWAPFAFAWALRGALSSADENFLVSWILFSVVVWVPELHPEPRARPTTNGEKTLPNERRDIQGSSRNLVMDECHHIIAFIFINASDSGDRGAVRVVEVHPGRVTPDAAGNAV
jgi:hypothetical protein